MTFAEFAEEQNGAPIDEETLANRILDMVDEEDSMWVVADDFLEALSAFRDELEEREFDLG